MPEKKRRELELRDWTDAEEKAVYFFMGTGADFGSPFGGDADALAEFYRSIQPEFLLGWSDVRPLSRPWIWWRENMPEGTRRERTDGGLHPFTEARRRDEFDEAVRKYGADSRQAKSVYTLTFGRPAIVFGWEHGPAPRYETQRQFLERLDLLTSEERALARKENNES